MTDKRVLKDEDFHLSSGLMDDFDALITDAWFAPPREEYVKAMGSGDTTPFLHLKLEGPELESPIEQVWSTGSAKQWKVARGGKEIISGKNANLHQFVETSRAGELVSRLITLAGGGDKAKGVEVVKSRGYFMTEAEFYLGLNCHWEREQRPTVSGETRDVLLPSAILGMSSAVPSAPVKSPFSDAEIATLVSLAPGKTEVQLKQQIMRSDLKGNKDLLNAVFNGNLLKTLVENGTLTKDPSGKYI